MSLVSAAELATDNDFGDALETALAQSDAYDETRNAVNALVAEVRELVAASLPGVFVGLRARCQMPAVVVKGTSPPVVKGTSRPKRIGDDAEDREVNLTVVGSVGREHRVLWEVTLDPGGFPVVVRGPDPGSESYCEDHVTLRQAFVRALANGVVGRKLRSLAKLAAQGEAIP